MKQISASIAEVSSPLGASAGLFYEQFGLKCACRAWNARGAWNACGAWNASGAWNARGARDARRARKARNARDACGAWNAVCCLRAEQ